MNGLKGASALQVGLFSEPCANNSRKLQRKNIHSTGGRRSDVQSRPNFWRAPWSPTWVNEEGSANGSFGKEARKAGHVVQESHAWVWVPSKDKRNHPGHLQDAPWMLLPPLRITLLQCLLHSTYHLKYFMVINSFNLHNNPMRQDPYYYSPFEIKGLRQGEVIGHPQGHPVPSGGAGLQIQVV